ncbi:MAG TPA: hypothetical protein VK041_02605, partial [Opitutales bacterium]|nr:hypothetical protein [Opitutales bacterium]
PNQAGQCFETFPLFFNSATVGENHKAFSGIAFEKGFPWEIWFSPKVERIGDFVIQAETPGKTLLNCQRMMGAFSARAFDAAIVKETGPFTCVVAAPFFGRTGGKAHQAGSKKSLHIPHRVEFPAAQYFQNFEEAFETGFAAKVNDFVYEGCRFGQKCESIAGDPGDPAIG